jgi:hypothetical protein
MLRIGVPEWPDGVDTAAIRVFFTNSPPFPFAFDEMLNDVKVKQAKLNEVDGNVKLGVDWSRQPQAEGNGINVTVTESHREALDNVDHYRMVVKIHPASSVRRIVRQVYANERPLRVKHEFLIDRLEPQEIRLMVDSATKLKQKMASVEFETVPVERGP